MRSMMTGSKNICKPSFMPLASFVKTLFIAIAGMSHFHYVQGGISNKILSSSGLKHSPNIVEDIQNITVTAGREAILSCVVENLGDYRVGWLKVDTQTILSLQKRVVTHNSRILVNHDEHRTWSLHIKSVKENDRGCYMCQINTPIMINRIGCVEVYVPPNIVDDMTSSETTINEGDNIILRCNAVGYPDPEVHWKREDKRAIKIATSGRDFIKMDKIKGENLTLTGVARRQMGAYLCIASNGVPPIVSKRIQLNVNFAPVVKVNNQLIGAPLGTEVEIQCHVEAFPLAINYWQRDNNEMLLKGRKFNLIEETKSYKTILKLQIKNFTNNDEGTYKCMSTNSLGKAETTIRLYVIVVPSPRSTTEQQTTHHLSTLLPSSGVNSLDMRQRENQQQHLSGKQYDPYSSNSNTDENPSTNDWYHEKQKFNYDSDDLSLGNAGDKNGLFDQEIGMSRSTYPLGGDPFTFLAVIGLLLSLLVASLL